MKNNPLFPVETEAQIIARLERTWRKQNGLKPVRKKSLRDHYREGMAECGDAPF